MPYVAIGADVLIAIKADRAESAFIKAQQSHRMQSKAERGRRPRAFPKTSLPRQ